MGVHGLWPLLEPVGRRVNIETLSHKRLAIDSSIWLFQFMRAMRDEQTGDMVKNAHLKGFFSRICRRGGKAEGAKVYCTALPACLAWRMPASCF